MPGETNESEEDLALQPIETDRAADADASRAAPSAVQGRPDIPEGFILPPLGVRDFVSAAWSRAVFSTMKDMMVGSFLSFLASVLCIIPIIIFFLYASGARWFYLRLAFAALSILVNIWCMGTIWRFAFAACERQCQGNGRSLNSEWTPIGSAMRAIFLMIVTAFIGVMVGLVLEVVIGDKAVRGGISLFVIYFVLPIAFLSLAQSGGNVEGLNPVRIVRWLVQIFPAYLGVLCLAAVSLFGTFGVCVLLWKLIIPAIKNATTAPRVLTLVFLYILYVLISFHPLAYFANLLGMLYRRYEDRLA